MIPHCHCNFLNHFIVEVHPFNLLLLKQAICRCEQLQRMPDSNSFVGAVTAAINGFSRTLWDLKNTQQDSSACNIIKKLIPVQNGLSSLQKMSDSLASSQHTGVSGEPQPVGRNHWAQGCWQKLGRMNLSFNLSDPMFFPFFRHAFVYRTLATIVLEPAAACPVLPDVSSLQPVTASLSTQFCLFLFCNAFSMFD